ncbi:hypothetical protein ABEV04_04245, partial [Heyndrickxia faecalis]|uniref:hypothetical protein n=1 Tax=Heyndrickxia faecalis TaxID=2824910 RepID=UPI003D1F1703
QIPLLQTIIEFCVSKFLLGCTESNSKATIGMTNRILLITEKNKFFSQGASMPKIPELFY